MVHSRILSGMPAKKRSIPITKVWYVLDVTVAWCMGSACGLQYSKPLAAAEAAEKFKDNAYKAARKREEERSGRPGRQVFVPLAYEATGGWGSARMSSSQWRAR